ncbi:MAG TPA: helix-turn-helix domain-containing protein [Steroidobacteraceae bacterium]|nr:helix-turn-helix domain-containing protein [Steroidobacteraceae bacterium]
MIGSRVHQARHSAGLSLRDLAERCGLSAMAISKYERGEITPSSEALLALSKALNVRVEYFFRQHDVQLEAVEYRKHADMPEKEKKRILADAREQLERWLALEEFVPTHWASRFVLPAGLPDKVESFDEVEEVAQAVRKAWKLGNDALPALIDMLELHGIKVFVTSIDGDRMFDGLSATANGKPVILIVGGSHQPGDRQRFTLAHELGHAVLKGRLGKRLDEEKACNRFAGAFLAPKDSVQRLLGHSRTWLEPRELQLLKQDWGLSMAGWMLRARDLGILNATAAAQMWSFFREHGWDKREPDPQYPREQSRGFEQLVYRALAEDQISESKAAELLGLPLGEFVAQRKMDSAPDAARR